MPKKRGRPIQKDEPKTKNLKLRLTQGDYIMLKQVAEHSGGTITAWLENQIESASAELFEKEEAAEED